MRVLLKLKSWQAFILLLGVPLIAYLLLGSSLTQGNRTNFFLIGTFEFVFSLMMLFWFEVLGVQVNLFVSKELRPKTRLFTFGIFFTAIYIIILQAFLIFYSGSYSLNELVTFIAPLHLISASLMFYCIYFISKNLLLAEKDKKVKIEELIGPFLALMFLPIGIWHLQPRINTLYQQNTT